jgi:hypothetical protein
MILDLPLTEIMFFGGLSGGDLAPERPQFPASDWNGAQRRTERERSLRSALHHL